MDAAALILWVMFLILKLSGVVHWSWLWVNFLLFFALALWVLLALLRVVTKTLEELSK